MQVIFISEKKLQKEHLSASENFFSNLCASSYLKPCCDENVNPYASTKQLKKQGIYIKKRAYERSNRHISNLYLSNQQFLVNLTFFQPLLCSSLIPVRIEMCINIHDKITEKGDIYSKKSIYKTIISNWHTIELHVTN